MGNYSLKTFAKRKKKNMVYQSTVLFDVCSTVLRVVALGVVTNLRIN